MHLRKLILVALFGAIVGCTDFSTPDQTQLDKEIKAIDDYLAHATFQYITANNNSGVRIGVTHFGAGAPPHDGQVVKITYTGRLLSDWSVFETGTINAKLETIPVEGLLVGIQALMEGTTATIFVASTHGFGTTGNAKVPANATLAYEVVLEKVEKTTAELTKFKADTTAIQKYLKDSTITATAIPGGVWYSVKDAGTGLSPNVYNLVTFHYKGYLLSTGELFQEGDVAGQLVFGLIDGLKLGLPLLSSGGTATYYIPSGLGYGTKANELIPANSNLIFEVKLNAVDN